MSTNINNMNEQQPSISEDEFLNLIDKLSRKQRRKVLNINSYSIRVKQTLLNKNGK